MPPTGDKAGDHGEQEDDALAGSGGHEDVEDDQDQGDDCSDEAEHLKCLGRLEPV